MSTRVSPGAVGADAGGRAAELGDDVRSEPASMQITVNGRAESYPASTTVGTLVARLSRSRHGIAVAVGDAVVPRAEWDARVLRAGDEVEILTAVQGG